MREQTGQITKVRQWIIVWYWDNSFFLEQNFRSRSDIWNSSTLWFSPFSVVGNTRYNSTSYCPTPLAYHLSCHGQWHHLPCFANQRALLLSWKQRAYIARTTKHLCSKKRYGILPCLARHIGLTDLTSARLSTARDTCQIWAQVIKSLFPQVWAHVIYVHDYLHQNQGKKWHLMVAWAKELDRTCSRISKNTICAAVLAALLEDTGTWLGQDKLLARKPHRVFWSTNESEPTMNINNNLWTPHPYVGLHISPVFFHLPCVTWRRLFGHGRWRRSWGARREV